MRHILRYTYYPSQGGKLRPHTVSEGKGGVFFWKSSGGTVVLSLIYRDQSFWHGMVHRLPVRDDGSDRNHRTLARAKQCKRLVIQNRPGEAEQICRMLAVEHPELRNSLAPYACDFWTSILRSAVLRRWIVRVCMDGEQNVCTSL